MMRFHKINKISSISSRNITSFKICDIANREKDIPDKAEREKIINLINSAGITRYNVPVPDGDGYGVDKDIFDDLREYYDEN